MPDTNFLGMLLYAGHGMMKDGERCFVLNQFDAKNEFYQLHFIEDDIRCTSAIYQNSYLVAIFACHYETYNKNMHSFCFAASKLNNNTTQDLKATQIEIHFQNDKVPLKGQDNEYEL